jgi:hypothetical protein
MSIPVGAENTNREMDNPSADKGGAINISSLQVESEVGSLPSWFWIKLKLRRLEGAAVGHDEALRGIGEATQPELGL